MERSFQIEFHDGTRVHWLRCSDEPTAKLTGSVLNANPVITFVEVIETTDRKRPRSIFKAPRF